MPFPMRIWPVCLKKTGMGTLLSVVALQLYSNCFSGSSPSHSLVFNAFFCSSTTAFWLPFLRPATSSNEPFEVHLIISTVKNTLMHQHGGENSRRALYGREQDRMLLCAAQSHHGCPRTGELTLAGCYCALALSQVVKHRRPWAAGRSHYVLDGEAANLITYRPDRSQAIS
jgi:hypothetical protein